MLCKRLAMLLMLGMALATIGCGQGANDAKQSSVAATPDACALTLAGQLQK